MEGKLLQVCFDSHVWESPDGSYDYSLSIIDMDCRLGGHGGTVILTDSAQSQASAFEVSCLHKELPGLLEKAGSDTVVYWRIENDPQERAKVSKHLTQKPVYFG